MDASKIAGELVRWLWDRAGDLEIGMADVEAKLINMGLAELVEATEGGPEHDPGDMLLVLTDAGRAACKLS